MPKLLNVVKLESKFQNLSRSRESIQGLSSWIMHHKEVYEEIVEQWLICISKNCNTLPMFYVANEIIQSCGKKKCPEFRDAFSKVMDEAASYEHVKEIKDKIFRLLNLWKERNLFDEEFYQRIENNLNSTEKESSSEEESEEEELSEQEIIKQFKKQKLIDQLEEIKSVELKRKEKEEILNYADVPDLSNFDEVIVRMDCQDTLKKCDAYLTLVKDFTKLIGNEMSLRKKLLKELKNNCIFYDVQKKDVKEVANAFRIYGKRVKTVETRLAEKITTFPMPSESPCFSEDITVSPSLDVPSYDDTDDASKNTLSSINELDESYFCGETWKENLSFSDKIPTQEVRELFGSAEQPHQEKNSNESTIPDFTTLNFSKITELIEETKSQNESTFRVQESNCSEDARNIILVKRNTNIFHDQTKSPDENLSDIPFKQTDLTERIKDFQVEDLKPVPNKKKTSEVESIKVVDKKVVKSTDSEYHVKNTLVESKSMSPIEQTCTTVEKEQSDSKQNKTRGQNNEDVDLLLEESYSKTSKTKLSYKRKIELLLKTKGKKQCSNQEHSEKISLKNDSPLPNAMEVDPKCENKKDDTNQKEDAEKRNSKGSKTHSESFAYKKLNYLNEDVDLASSIIESVSDNIKHSDRSLNINNLLTDSGLCSNDNKKQSEKETLPFSSSGAIPGLSISTDMCPEEPKQSEIEAPLFNPSGTFTGSDMLSLMSNLSTGVFSKDTEKLENETLSFNVSDTFTGTTLSSLISTDMDSKDSKQQEAETLAFNESSTFTGSDLSFLVSSNTSSEDPKQSATETLPTFTGSALSSFMSGMSTDFLKNILQKNQQNTLVNTDESDPKALGIPSEAKSDSPVKKVFSNIPYNLTNNDVPIEEEHPIKDCVMSTDVLPVNSEDSLKTTEMDISSENVKTETLLNTDMELTELSSDAVQKPKYSDKLNSSLSVKEVEYIPSTNNSKYTVSPEIVTKSSTNVVPNKKPNLLETLENVLVCLSENMESKCDVKKLPSEEYKELELPLSIERMLSIYNYLRGDNTKFINNSFSCPEITSNNSNTVSVVNFSTNDNYEVMDMECDSEDDDI